MDEIITKKPAPTMEPMRPSYSMQTPPEQPGFHQHLHRHRSTRTLVIILGILLVIIAALIVWWEFFHTAKSVPLTPEQTLGQLKGSSQPVTATPQQRATALSDQQKTSVPVVVSSQQRMNTLNALKK